MSAPARWSVQHEALHADCKVFRVYKEHSLHPLDKREGDFFVIHANDWVLALPLTDDGRLVMVRQFRFGLQDLSTETPGGVIDAGEDPILAADGVEDLEGLGHHLGADSVAGDESDVEGARHGRKASRGGEHLRRRGSGEGPRA